MRLVSFVCLRGWAARVSDVQTWLMVYGHLTALLSEAAPVEELLQASIAPETRRKYRTVASVDSTVALLASVASDGSRAESTSAAATMSWFHIVAGFGARSKLYMSGSGRPLTALRIAWMVLATVNVRSECRQYCRLFDRTVPPAVPVLRGHRLVRLLQSRDIRLYAD